MPNQFKRKFSTIEGVSDRRRLPMLGKIRLGIVVKNSKGNNPKCQHPNTINEYCDFCSHPKDVPYFIVPDEVKKVYGDKPTELKVMFPINDIETIFPQSYRWYGSNGLKCEGNGSVAVRWDEEKKAMVERECTCEQLKSEQNPKGQCGKQASLYIMLYEVSMGGVYRIISGSINTIIQVASGLEFHEQMMGRFARVPLILKRVEQETQYVDAKGKKIKSIHYPLQITSNLTVSEVQKLMDDNQKLLPETSPARLALPVHEDDNPRKDIGATVVTDDEEPAETKPAEATVKDIPEPAPKPEPKPEPESKPAQPPANQNGGILKINDAQRKKLMPMLAKIKFGSEDRKMLYKSLFKKESTMDLTAREASTLIQNLLDLQDGKCDLRYRDNGEPYFDYPK